MEMESPGKSATAPVGSFKEVDVTVAPTIDAEGGKLFYLTWKACCIASNIMIHQFGLW